MTKIPEGILQFVSPSKWLHKRLQNNYYHNNYPPYCPDSPGGIRLRVQPILNINKEDRWPSMTPAIKVRKKRSKKVHINNNVELEDVTATSNASYNLLW